MKYKILVFKTEKTDIEELKDVKNYLIEHKFIDSGEYFHTPYSILITDENDNTKYHQVTENTLKSLIKTKMYDIEMVDSVKTYLRYKKIKKIRKLQ